VTSKQNQRKHIFRAGLVTLIMGSVVGLTGLFSAPAGAAVQSHQIEICHATSSQSHPFTTPTPAKWQITAPHGHGTVDTLDIIPPFAAGTFGSHSWAAYGGLNWDTTYPGTDLTGEEIAAAGCNVVEPAVGSITLDKVTSGDGQPADTTDFDFTVTCQDATVADASPSVSPEDPALTVATDVAVETSCTITETGTAGAASTTYSVDGGPEVSGTSATVTMASADQTIAVVFTNTYACASGSTADGQGGCTQQCVPTAENNQCTPCETGTPDGQGGCTQSCAPTVENNQCTPCDAGETADGAGNCTTVEDVILTPTPGGTQVEGVTQTRTPQVAAVELPRTGKATLPLVELGLGLVLLGLGALLAARDEAESA
jgi:hypothetical protein